MTPPSPAILPYQTLHISTAETQENFPIKQLDVDNRSPQRRIEKLS